MSDSFMHKNPYLTEQITVSSSAIPLTAASVANTALAETDGSTPARWAVAFPATAVTIEVSGSNAIYYTLDGSTPSSTNGLKLSGGDFLTVLGRAKISNFKMIRVSSDATVNVVYYNG